MTNAETIPSQAMTPNLSISGLPGLRLIKGFRDEALSGEWRGYRSSRLGLQWRVIYRVVAEKLRFQVASITAHDYRRP
jgi:addiction module RelE/StbE family toxin